MLAVCRRCVLSGLLAPECNEEHEQSRDGMSKYSKYSNTGRCNASNRSAWASCRIPGPVARVRWLVGSGGCDQPMLRPRVLGAGPCHDCPRPQSGGTPRPRHTASYCAELHSKYKYYLDLLDLFKGIESIDTYQLS